MLEVRNLTKVYDDGTVALRNVSFQVEDGEFLAIIGLSGAGKSTLLRCINRLIDATGGGLYLHLPPCLQRLDAGSCDYGGKILQIAALHSLS